MHALYERTSLTPMRAARMSGYIDWVSQPSLFKHYPDFLFRYAFGEQPELRIAELARMVTSRSNVGGKPYVRLSPPSAGNLHPLELYVQVRGIKGLLSGIYHVDAGKEQLVLIREIGREGLEPELGLTARFNGLLFVLSCVPFRAEWKYGERAVRYCFLDAGHQIGAVKAAAGVCEREATYLSDFDALRLDKVMGFGGEEHSCAVLSVGTAGTKPSESLKAPLMQVAPTDYCESAGQVAQSVFDALEARSGIAFAEPIGAEASAVLSRRSARRFCDNTLEASVFEHFMHLLHQPPEPLRCHTVVLRSENTAPGIYADSGLTQSGKYADTLVRLLVDQTFVKSAAMVIVFSAKCFDAGTLMSAGAFAQKLALDAEQRGVGFTGIGAFYDTKLQRFLSTENYILYVCAIGTKGTE